jgi:acyl dehydratase
MSTDQRAACRPGFAGGEDKLWSAPSKTPCGHGAGGIGQSIECAFATLIHQLPEMQKMTEQFLYFEDYKPGHERLTTGRTITETDIVVHAGHTGDFFPHHLDAEFAKTLPGGQRIAHGTMIFSIGIGLTASLINPLAFSYGYDRLRFVRPVVIGDTIKTRITIGAKEDDPKRPDMGRVIERCEVFNQRNEVVLAAHHILLVARKSK